MKKLISLVLASILTLFAATAFAVEYTLPEKLQRQIEFGNGLKGTLQVSVEGNGEWVKLFSSMNGAEIQLRGIHKDDSFQYQAYALNGEEQVGLTQLYGDNQTVYLRSELLPDTLLSLSTGGDIVNRLLGGGEDENPTWYSAALNLLTVPATSWEEKWLPVLDKYDGMLEMWLNDFAAEPVVNREKDSASTMTIRYDIPMKDAKAQTKALLEQFLQDEELLTLLRAQTTPAQQAIYLNPNLMFYYEQVIDSFELEGAVSLERELTTKGEMNSTTITLPLPENAEGWEQVTLEQQKDTNTVTLDGGKASVTLSLEKAFSTGESVAYRGSLRIVPAEEDARALAVAFTATSIHSNTVDDDTRRHDVTTWSISIQPDAEEADEENIISFEPISLDARIHLHSKQANLNATTLAVDCTAQLPGGTADVAFEIKTASPWVLETLPTAGAVSMETMTQEERIQALTDIALNGLVSLAAMNAVELPDEAADAATTTDLEFMAPLETGAPEPTTVPAITATPTAEPDGSAN